MVKTLETVLTGGGVGGGVGSGGGVLGGEDTGESPKAGSCQMSRLESWISSVFECCPSKTGPPDNDILLGVEDGEK